jgi:methionine-gamma-lyase
MKNDHRKFRPETLMMSHGYKPELSEGALKCPIFQTSTFVFKTAEEGKAFFEIANGMRQKGPREELGLIYSRLNNPDLEILEDRLCLWDEAEDCAVFESGMSAISTVFLEFLKPGDLLLFSTPVYGGTDYFIKHILPRFGIDVMAFPAGQHHRDIRDLIDRSGHAHRLAMIYVETPANPTNALVDIAGCAAIARSYSRPEREVLLTVDNTFMGPLWSHPLKLGADLVVYSATKYIGGHSDVIAGALPGQKGAHGAGENAPHLPGQYGGPVDRLAADAQPGNAQAAHGASGGQCRPGGPFSAGAFPGGVGSLSRIHRGRRPRDL